MGRRLRTEGSEGGRARGTALVAAAIAGAAVLVGGLVLWRLRDDGRDVAVVGDSVAFLSGGAIDARFEGDDVGIVAKPGYRTADLLGPFEEALAGDGPVASRDVGVFLVGYNDVRLSTVGSDALTEMVDASASFECAIWMTLPARPGGEPAGDPKWDAERFEQWNARLDDEVARHPELHLVRGWEALVTDNDPAALFKPDRIHPNEAGARRLADAMGDAVDRLC